MQKLTVGHQKKTIDRMENDINFFKTQTSKVTDNLLERQETSKSNSRVDPPLKIYQPKMVPRFAKQLVISDCTFRKVNQNDISQQTAIHSYSSATKEDISNVVYCYSPRAKTETLIVHVIIQLTKVFLDSRQRLNSKEQSTNVCKNSNLIMLLYAKLVR